MKYVKCMSKSMFTHILEICTYASAFCFRHHYPDGLCDVFNIAEMETSETENDEEVLTFIEVSSNSTN